MPNLSPQEYEELRNLISAPDPDGEITPEMREAAYQAISTFDEQFETGMRGGLSTEQALAMGPPSNEQDDVIRRLDPSQPLMAQALATAPATTHPGGDKAAEQEWLSGSGGQNGTVFVYEPPLERAKKKLMENPQLSAALGYQHIPFTAQDIAAMQKGDSLYQAYADYEWKRTAEESAKAGKVAYRHSKTPWLHGAKALGAVPLVAQGIGALIMGVDDAASFGLSGAATGAPSSGSPMGDERRLLEQLPGENPADAMDVPAAPVEFQGLRSSPEDVVADNPAAHTAGQALGALTHWSPTNRLFNFVAEGGQQLAGKMGGGLLARTATAGGSGALAGAAEQGVREVVTGSGAANPEGVLGRLGGAAGLGSGFGAGGEVVGSAAKGIADWVRWGGRYEGAPGRLETSGLTPKFGRGYVEPPEIKQATQEGRALGGIEATDVLAKKAAPGVEAGADEMVKEVIGRATKVQQDYYPSAEGQYRLPLTKSAETVIDIARAGISRDEKGRAFLIGRDELKPLLKRFNNEIVGSVSLKPVEGAIELSADEADLLLSPSWKRKLVPPKEPKGGGSGGGGGGGARDVDLVSIGDTPRVDIEARGEQRTMDVEDADIEDVDAPARTPVQTSDVAPSEVLSEAPPVDGGATRPTPARNAAIKEFGEAMAPGREARAADDQRAARLARDMGLSAAAASGAEAVSEGSGGDVGAAAGVFATAMKRRGHGKVYIVPNRLTAEAHDAFTDRIQDHAKPVMGQNKPAQREWGMLQKAAFQDRDARPYQGAAGGWSAIKKAESEAIGQAKDLQSRVTSGRDGAFREIVQYARPRTGELLDVEALRKAADKGGKGVREQIDRARQAGDIEKVRSMSSYGRGSSGQRVSPLSPTGAFDALTLRFAQPGLRALEGSGMRGGAAGRFSLIGRNAPVLEEEEQK